MKSVKYAIFGLLLLSIAGLVFLFQKERYQPPIAETLSSLFLEIGKPVQSFNRTLTQLMPIDKIDEKMLGEELKAKLTAHYRTSISSRSKELLYLNALVRHLTQESQKGFAYTVFVCEGAPNAHALPGGVILVTTGLLELVESEAELVSVLCHEIGHIERGHLFTAAREQMLRKKHPLISLTTYATESFAYFGRFLFSQTQENEADEYAFLLLIKKGYSPFAMSDVFSKFAQLTTQKETSKSAFLRTHPHPALRENKFYHLAQNWLPRNPQAKIYIGIRNLKELKPFHECIYEEEFFH